MRGKAGQDYQAIVIGASARSINALGFLFSELEEDFPLPLLVTRHSNAQDDSEMLRKLARQSSLPVKLAKDKERISAGIIYFTPAGYYMQIQQNGIISLNMEPPVVHIRPSIDLLFQSAAKVYEEALVAIVLTEENSDGAQGIQAVKDFGGTTIVQCPDSAKATLMPREFLKMGCIDFQLSLEEIPRPQGGVLFLWRCIKPVTKYSWDSRLHANRKRHSLR
ncbi:MAG: chemotaxis protein CheB [Endozoicomonas sp.]